MANFGMPDSVVSTSRISSKPMASSMSLTLLGLRGAMVWWRERSDTNIQTRVEQAEGRQPKYEGLEILFQLYLMPCVVTDCDRCACSVRLEDGREFRGHIDHIRARFIQIPAVVRDRTPSQPDEISRQTSEPTLQTRVGEAKKSGDLDADPRTRPPLSP